MEPTPSFVADAAADNLANQVLIALPALDDPNFSRSVTLICQHDADGAMGVMVNRASEYTLGEVFRQMGIESDDEALCARAVIAGGPVHPERGFVLHDGGRSWDSSLAIADGLYVTTSRDVLEAMARGEGPELAAVALGCAGWGSGQLEHELVENSWLTAPADRELLFELPLELRWQAAAGRIGVDLARIADYSGHA
ncbi:MAG: YqgE/AlgH family protein [Luteimonas sp.]